MEQKVNKTYKLVDSSHSRFDRYYVLLDGVAAYQECFMKGEDPNIFLAWRRWSHEKRSHYIWKCIEKGEAFEDTINRLRIQHSAYTFYKNKLWSEGKTISEYRKTISEVKKRNISGQKGISRGPYKRRKVEGVAA